MVIEKHAHDKVVDRWTGARYGPRQEFAEYAEQAGLRKGFLEAPLTVFPADGAHHNWDLQQASTGWSAGTVRGRRQPPAGGSRGDHPRVAREDRRVDGGAGFFSTRAQALRRDERRKMIMLQVEATNLLWYK